MKSTVKLLMLIILFLSITSCAPREKVYIEIAPGINFPSDEMNVRIKLNPIEGITQLKLQKVLFLDLVNISHTPIVFPQDYGVEIFVKKENQWIKVRNDFWYGPGDKGVLPQEVDELGDAVVSIYPLIEDTGQSAMVRVIVIGTVYQNDQPTSTKTAAYVDLILQP
ncbi:MAG: hypothetical protein HY258_02625 [Chloroflexi bacterium]|nr:hypothetical protein [Chloroflexota bacterium]